MFKRLASRFHLFPDVVMGQEASQLSLCQWATMIGVTVSREHVDAHSLNFTDIHRSEIEREEQTWRNGNKKGQKSVITKY